MRNLVPILMTILAAILVGVAFLPWGVVRTPWGYDDARDGWLGVLPVDALFPASFGDGLIPHSVAIGAVGLATIAAWLRGRKPRVPVVVPLLLTGYATYHAAMNVQYYASGRAIELTRPLSLASRVGTGGYLGLACCALAFVTTLCMIRPNRESTIAPAGETPRNDI